MVSGFHWHEGLDQPFFNALTSILSLRNDGTLEPPTRFTLDDILQLAGGSADSTSRPEISHLDVLTRRFLDRLAELASRQKGAERVSCTALKEEKVKVRIWVTMNNGFDEMDRIFFQKLEILLNAVASAGDISAFHATSDELWRAMLDFYRPRLAEYAADLRLWLTDIPTWRQRLPLSLLQTEPYCSILELYQLSLTNGDGYAALVNKSYQLTRRSNDRQVTHQICDQIHRKLWVGLCWMGQLETARRTFVDIARRKWRSHTITIECSRETFRPSIPPSPLTLRETISRISSVIGRRPESHPRDSTSDFMAVQRKERHVHAEIQMLLLLLQKEIVMDGSALYLGCSKRSCFLCWHLLQKYRGATTRGCHGRLFPRWTIPSVIGLTSRTVERLKAAVQDLQTMLTEQSIRIPPWMNPPPLSSVGTLTHPSSVVDITPRPSNHTSIDSGTPRALSVPLEEDIIPNTDSSGSETPRALSLETFLNISDSDQRQGSLVEEKQDLSDESASPLSASTTNQCDFCLTTSRKCSRCGVSRFCSISCERGAWESHKFDCVHPSMLNTAELLELACLNNRLPDDSQTLEDFGFDRLPTYSSQAHLLRIYMDLIMHMSIPTTDLHRWQINMVLAENVTRIFTDFPPRDQADLMWFKYNISIFDAPSKSPEKYTSTNRQIRMAAAARQLLHPEDCEVDLNDLSPGKLVCMWMYSITVQGFHVGPHLLAWRQFGFCVCSSRTQASKLGSLYQELIGVEADGDIIRGRCTFDEFLHSYELGTLVELMDSKDLKPDRLALGIHHLEDFLSDSQVAQLSVWDLKVFVESDPLEEHRMNSNLDEFGFAGCVNPDSVIELKRIYGKVLTKADPLALQEACAKGDLYSFCRGYLPHLDPRFEEILAR
ncbi:hypothetical protein C8J56DRAFT_1156816 [Mycena floridula]|nr:hypothetical protein C8J56DRAFT_1156816 [Mycena floridula]